LLVVGRRSSALRLGFKVMFVGKNFEYSNRF
jgi:hypothetical protein